MSVFSLPELVCNVGMSIGVPWKQLLYLLLNSLTSSGYVSVLLRLNETWETKKKCGFYFVDVLLTTIKMYFFTVMSIFTNISIKLYL